MAVSDPLFLDKANPELWKSLGVFSDQLAVSYRSAGISDRLAELVNLRVSQINGCSYCLDLHIRRALEAGETMQRISLLGLWEDVDLFDETERAALAIAEAATELPCYEERVAALSSARLVLGEEQFSVIQWLAISMNAFNRISILSRHPVRPREFVAVKK
ncbi:carboxymuconolactone decarboxylase family protein [Glutamicibacter sp. MNS18]|uniref:carboxymuconolactone decarboxylase family protein n=1 Tax=Glutamicibacter sp. MNS18 TaxID=2989817 RepID=UPI00223612BE|nr:carboxymuconolactone decarboxylase family protein [Glutamicibacter sp. MNS18]MCW4465502.1 carboxymuconolactone decarboxylase family protein [Glutamicibacter sp. MNS18]